MSERVPTRREERAGQTRDRIIDAALGVYSRMGAAGATTKEIAQAAGVAQGLLYHYFRSKEALLRAVLERHSFLPGLRAILSGAEHRPAAAVMREVGHRFSETLKEKEAMIDLLLGEGRRVPEIAAARAELMSEGLGLFAGYLQARVAAGELRPHRADITVRALMSTIIIMHVAGTVDTEAIDILVDNLLIGVLRPREDGPQEGSRAQ